MDFQNRAGGKTGTGGVASWSESNRDRRERLRQLTMEKNGTIYTRSKACVSISRETQSPGHIPLMTAVIEETTLPSSCENAQESPAKEVDPDLICVFCHTGFSSENLTTHSLTHTGPTPYCCNQCEKTFSTSTKLQSHVLGFHPASKIFACGECQLRFYSIKRLRAHLAVHLLKKHLTCPECLRTYSNKYTFKAHLRVYATVPHHASTKGVDSHKSPKPQVRDIVGEQDDPTSNSKPKTAKTYDQICYNCRTGFCDIADKIKHMSTHNGDHPFECSQCHQTFSSSTELSFHEGTHWVKRIFRCDKCPKLCTAAWPLVLHMRSHTRTTSAKLECPKNLVVNHKAIAVGMSSASTAFEPGGKVVDQENIDGSGVASVLEENNRRIQVLPVELNSNTSSENRRSLRHPQSDSTESLAEQWQDFLAVIKSWT